MKFVGFLLRRVLAVLPVALGVMLLTSSMIRLVPGDPVDSIAGDYASDQEKQELRAALGLDQSWLKQTAQSVWKTLQGDFGRSLIENREVSSMILERVIPTVELAIVAMVVTIAISLPLGILAAAFAGSAIDLLAMMIALLGVSIPNFWMGPMLVLLFSLHLGWFPVSERGDWASYVLPALTLGTALAAVLSRMTRNAILDTMREDYVRTARAKGVNSFSLFTKHILRNAALPLITIAGLQFGVLLTGAVVTEKIFDWPGLGSLMLEGLTRRDYPVVQGCVLVFASTYVLVNLLTDLTYALVDPRIEMYD